MREITPFGVRIPPELKSRLESAAKAAGRSLNAEVLARLHESMKKDPVLHQLEEPTPEYRALTDAEHRMLTLYRKWSPEQQLSFLVLFRK